MTSDGNGSHGLFGNLMAASDGYSELCLQTGKERPPCIIQSDEC